MAFFDSEANLQNVAKPFSRSDDVDAKGMGIKLIVNVPELIPDYRELLQRSLETSSELVRLNALFVLVVGLDQLLRKPVLPANIRDILSCK
jgi:hypothetical protein